MVHLPIKDAPWITPQLTNTAMATSTMIFLIFHAACRSRLPVQSSRAGSWRGRCGKRNPHPSGNRGSRSRRSARSDTAAQAIFRRVPAWRMDRAPSGRGQKRHRWHRGTSSSIRSASRRAGRSRALRPRAGRAWSRSHPYLFLLACFLNYFNSRDRTRGTTD